MLYAVLCYNDEEIAGDWSKEADGMVMARLAAVTQKQEQAGKLSPGGQVV